MYSETFRNCVLKGLFIPAPLGQRMEAIELSEEFVHIEVWGKQNGMVLLLDNSRGMVIFVFFFRHRNINSIYLKYLLAWKYHFWATASPTQQQWKITAEFPLWIPVIKKASVHPKQSLSHTFAYLVDYTIHFYTRFVLVILHRIDEIG